MTLRVAGNTIIRVARVLAIAGSVLSARADEKEPSAWPEPRPLGRDLPSHRGQPPSGSPSHRGPPSS
ncbi:MAG: hypothetical protein KBA51_02535, partial [Kiritimatiellae bacterium]|nr:hypothetical protein [Kiritimatiellia bacterium]